jgi:hypothetical protein
MPNEKDLMEWMLHEQEFPCVSCGNPRVRIPFGDLSPEEQAEFNVDPSTVEYCLYCSHCDNYSVISRGGSSFEDRAPKSKLLKGSPSLNSPCPCGSGKKYKRCCGKN